MSDLTEFVLARVAEDEAAARHSLDGDIEYLPSLTTKHGDVLYLGVTHPTHVLAECEAHRRIVMEFEQVHADYRLAPTPTMEGQRFGLAKAVAALAAVYDTHPDYRKEWRP